MTTLEQPSAALNDLRVATEFKSKRYFRRFQMWKSQDVAKQDSRDKIVQWVVEFAKSAPGGKLLNLVLSCHGLPAYLQLGQGFDQSHIPMFGAWQGLVGKIWLPDCLVAEIPDKNMQKKLNHDHWRTRTGSGHLFCSTLARTVHCYVVAPTEIQCDIFKTFPPNQISSFEGLILSYSPDGQISWSDRNPSIWYHKPHWYSSNKICVPVPD
jgi:hypothetical protein